MITFALMIVRPTPPRSALLADYCGKRYGKPLTINRLYRGGGFCPLGFLRQYPEQIFRQHPARVRASNRRQTLLKESLTVFPYPFPRTRNQQSE